MQSTVLRDPESARFRQTNQLYNISQFGFNEESKKFIEDCDRLFGEKVEEVRKARESGVLSPSEEAALLGRCTKYLRQLDDAASKRLGYPLHRYCCCHVKEHNVENSRDQLKSAWPLLQDPSIRWTDYPESIQTDEKLKGLSATLMSWSLGGGHNVVRDSLSSRLASRGMHIYKVAADEEVLKKFDFVHNISGGRISSGDVVNFLMRHNFWFLLTFIIWFFGI